MDCLSKGRRMGLENVAARLPAISAALALEQIGMEIQRDHFGPKWCAAHGTGARRKKLGKAPVYFAAPLASEAALMSAEDAMAWVSDVTRDQCRVLLSEMCRLCRYEKCPLKTW